MIRVLALLCPFLYLSASLSGILHGLGKTSHFFLYSLTAQTLRLLCVLLLTPRIGIIGCLLGIIGNELLLVILCSFTLSREGVLRFSAKNALIRPVFFLILSVDVPVLSPLCLLEPEKSSLADRNIPLCDNTYILRSFTGLRFDTSAENPPPHVFPCRQEIKVVL